MNNLTDIPPKLAALGRIAKAAKNRSVKLGDGKTLHYVDAYRADRRILRVAVPNAEDVVGLLNNAPAALCADYMVIAADTWRSDRPTNPITGEEWQFGDMDHIAEADLGVERGLLSEAIMLMGFERGGAEHHAELDYNHDRPAATITWGVEGLVDFDSRGGRFPRVAAEGFARPTFLDEVTKAVGPPPEGFDVERMIRMAAVSWVLTLPRDWQVIEGPKGPPLGGE